MYSSDKTKSPPKIRLKMENHEKYESLFRNNNIFKPLNPPPFSLNNIANADFRMELDCNSCTTNIVTPCPSKESVKPQEDSKQDTHDAAILLASMKKLIEKEVHSCAPNKSLPRIPDLEKHFSRTPKCSNQLKPTSVKNFPAYSPDYFGISTRVRAVSMDSHQSIALRGDSSMEGIQTIVKPECSSSRHEGPACISPTASPLLCPYPLPLHTFAKKSLLRGADRRKRYLDEHADGSSEDELEVVKILKPKVKKIKISKTRPSNKSASKEPKKGSKSTNTVLRKKFSWKNYPELENFLIANREEYLRHSALNYTMQQKQYNNRLTERLVDLATECGYVFDSNVFTFVTIRDRIRCYFKSYVQSRKKRGVIIGYAARKAGLLSDKELEKSAVTKGKIVGGESKMRRK
jgi:hypothetical protein